MSQVNSTGKEQGIIDSPIRCLGFCDFNGATKNRAEHEGRATGKGVKGEVLYMSFALGKCFPAEKSLETLEGFKRIPTTQSTLGFYPPVN